MRVDPRIFQRMWWCQSGSGQWGRAQKRWLALLACLVIGGLGIGVAYHRMRAQPQLLPEVPMDPNSPEEREFRRLMRAHIEARNEVMHWIKTEIAGRKSLAPPPNALMKSRLEGRLVPLVAGYADYLKRNPHHVRARQSAQWLQEDLKGEGGLVRQWEQAHGIDVREPDAWRRLANYYGHIGEVKRAFQCYARAIELDPTEPVYFQEYALTVFLYRRDAREHFQASEQQVFDRALELYEQGLKLDPKNGSLALEIAECYYIIRPPRPAAALKAWQRVLKLTTTERQREQVYLNLARVEIAAEHFDSARKYLLLVKSDSLGRLKERVSKTLAEREKKAADTAAAASKSSVNLD